MIIQMDTREQCGKKDHILSYFEQAGIKVVRSKLFVGDWTRLDKQDVCIDTKTGGLQEAYGNVVQQHVRFRNECIRARQNGIRLIVLVEEERISRLEDVCMWENPRRAKWFELDQDYYRAASERLEKEKSMQPLFEPQEIYKQGALEI